MTTTEATDFGVVQFMPIETFIDPTRGLDGAACVDRIVEELLLDAPPKPQSIADWPRVQIALLRLPSSVFVIETVTPAFTATLHFCPERPDSGDYVIRYRPRVRVEKGRTEKISVVAADATDPCVSMLTPFATRYAVVTVGLERPRARMMWLVGLTNYRTVDERDDGAAYSG